jgi:proliferating cell nuclear antigen
MDSSHVALVSLNLTCDGFESYRADTNMVLGVNIANLAKVMKLADNIDTITLQAESDASHLKITFHNPKTEYSSIVQLGSGEFSRICRELYSISETVTITTSEQFVQFNVDGDVGSGSVKLGHNEGEKKED